VTSGTRSAPLKVKHWSKQAASLRVIAQLTRDKALLGDADTARELTRVQNLAARALRALGVSASRAKPQGGLAALNAHLASKAAASRRQ